MGLEQQLILVQAAGRHAFQRDGIFRLIIDDQVVTLLPDVIGGQIAHVFDRRHGRKIEDVIGPEPVDPIISIAADKLVVGPGSIDRLSTEQEIIQIEVAQLNGTQGKRIT